MLNPKKSFDHPRHLKSREPPAPCGRDKKNTKKNTTSGNAQLLQKEMNKCSVCYPLKLTWTEQEEPKAVEANTKLLDVPLR